MTKNLTCYGHTDKGRVRKKNEDNLLLDIDGGIFIVSDGMGGHAAGELASQLVVERLPELLKQRLKGTLNISSPSTIKHIENAVNELNEYVNDYARSKPGLSGMGATIVMMLVNGQDSIISHLGDSRAYLFRDGRIRLLTKDHSLIQALLDTGEITPKDVPQHPARGKITRCIGMPGEITPESQPLRLKQGDRIILCSDGLTGMLPDRYIAKCLEEYVDQAKLVKLLIDAANNAGGVDNITVLSVDYCINKNCDAIMEESSSTDTVEFDNHVSVMKDIAEPVAFVIDMDSKPSKFCLPITYPYFSIGREPNSHLCLYDDTTVSRNHCVIRVEEVSGHKELMVEDLQSRNGTYLNGKRLQGQAKLPVPSWLVVGKTRLSIIPSASDFNQEAFIEDAYTSEGSILIPPSEFFKERSEALLVVDLVGSTKIVQKHGDTKFVKIVSAIGQMLEKELQKETQPFLKCTGDGFFATFSNANAAIKAGIKLAPILVRHFTIPIQLSVALHVGPVRLTQDGERTGRNAHAVFSVEDLRHKNEKISALLTKPGKLDLILMTEDFWQTLDPAYQMMTKPIGAYPLKGRESDTTIYMWKGKN